MILFQFIFAIIQWLTSNLLAYTWTEKIKHPQWIDFAEVMYCRKCFTFWLNLFAFLCVYLATNHQYHYYLGLGLILTVLAAIGMHIEQKNKTIKI